MEPDELEPTDDELAPESFALIQEHFPGAAELSEDELEALAGSDGPVGLSPAAVLAAEVLSEAVGAMLEFFGREEPLRLERVGFVRLAKAKEKLDKALAAPVKPRAPARADGSINEKIAAVRVAPTVGTKQEQVLAVLRGAAPDWIDGERLAQAGCGGSEGLRRLRELRSEKGWPIEARPHPDRATSWQYRLAEPLA